MKHMHTAYIKKHTGFALLMSVIVTGTLLLIVYALSNISLKELILTYTGRESQVAFYAADTGVECALFWDLKNPGNGNSAFDPFNGPSVISCNGNTIQAGDSVPTVPTPTLALVGGGGINNSTSTFYINLEPLNDSGSGPCAIVRVGKTKVGSATTTTIMSRGYNTCDLQNTRRLERGLRVIY